MKVVCLCGSTRFKELFKMCIRKLIEKGIVPLYPDYFENYDGNSMDLTDEEIENLKKIHFRKIELCDTVLVLNPFKYIGESTAREIDYARKMGKKIIYFHDNFFEENVNKCIDYLIDWSHLGYSGDIKAEPANIN